MAARPPIKDAQVARQAVSYDEAVGLCAAARSHAPGSEVSLDCPQDAVSHTRPVILGAYCPQGPSPDRPAEHPSETDGQSKYHHCFWA